MYLQLIFVHRKFCGSVEYIPSLQLKNFMSTDCICTTVQWMHRRRMNTHSMTELKRREIQSSKSYGTNRYTFRGITIILMQEPAAKFCRAKVVHHFGTHGCIQSYSRKYIAMQLILLKSATTEKTHDACVFSSAHSALAQCHSPSYCTSYKKQAASSASAK